MATGIFQTLPEELLSEIERALPFQDRLQLSTVDSRFRRCFTPGLYTTIRFSNRVAEQGAIADIINKYGRYAHGLALTLDLGIPEPRESDIDQTANGSWYAPGLPTSARDVLIGKTLPGISSFSIDFVADPGGEIGFRGDELGYDDWAGLWGYMMSEDAAEQLAEEERQNAWRQCLAAMWQALADNPGPIRHLAVPKLIPAPSSAWQTPAWAAFMGRLESLSLGMWDVQGILDDDEYECQDVKGMLDRDWYGHATALRRLEIVAGPGNLYAAAMWGDGSITVGNDDATKLPSLRELRIVNCLLSDALARLIATRAVLGLGRIELVRCASGAPYIDAQDPCWEFFFLSILRFLNGDGGRRWNAAVESRRASGRSLLEIEDFVLLHGRKTAELLKMGEAEACLLEKKGISREGLGFCEIRNLQVVCERRERIRQQRYLGRYVNENELIFPYAFRDVRSGSIGLCVHATVTRATGGRDAAAFKVLMDYVKTSSERG